jgi:hypothetical protein
MSYKAYIFFMIAFCIPDILSAFRAIKSAPSTTVQAQELDEVVHRTRCATRQQLYAQQV